MKTQQHRLPSLVTVVGWSQVEVAPGGISSSAPQSLPLPTVSPVCKPHMFTFLTLLTPEFVTATLVSPVKGWWSWWSGPFWVRWMEACPMPRCPGSHSVLYCHEYNVWPGWKDGKHPSRPKGCPLGWYRSNPNRFSFFICPSEKSSQILYCINNLHTTLCLKFRAP